MYGFRIKMKIGINWYRRENERTHSAVQKTYLQKQFFFCSIYWLEIQME